MGTLRTPTTARSVLRINPRRRLRADTRVHVDSFTKDKQSTPLPGPVGGYWRVVTFFDPEVDRDPRELSDDDFWDEDVDKFYKKTALGGVWAWWPSEAGYSAGEPGKVEFIAAGSGFGPDILEASADVFSRPLVLGRGWNPANDLFKRYGGTVEPRGAFRLKPVKHLDARVGPGQFAVRTSASEAFNALSLRAGILPRYQSDGDRYVEDPAKLAADEQA